MPVFSVYSCIGSYTNYSDGSASEAYATGGYAYAIKVARGEYLANYRVCLMNTEQHQEELRESYEKETLRLAGVRPKDTKALHGLLSEWPEVHPPWTGSLDEYDSRKYGPLFAVSDDGENAQTIAQAAHASAKARMLHPFSAMALGVMIDGERMTSSGEAPIGPDEYHKLISAAFGRTLCSTNVGVRVNARLYRVLPEFSIAAASVDEMKWLNGVFASFRPFLKSPDGLPRPLTVRLTVQPGDSLETIRNLVAKLETGRAQGLIGPPSVHRISLLAAFNGVIREGVDIDEIKRLLEIASKIGVQEVALDGEMVFGARQRISVQSLLNILEVGALRKLLAIARAQTVRLVYRYQVDIDSAARSIWTGLNTARSYGFTAGKYGLVPLDLEEQERVVRLISLWTKGWTAIPAFYVDTPLVTHGEIFDEERCMEGALLWMERVRGAGAKLALIDSPDRVTPRHLLLDGQYLDNKAILTLEHIVILERRARELGLKVMWSGGITARQAFSLSEQGVFAIFSTSATARQVAVHGSFKDDPELASEAAPTELGVRRVHAAIQGGFLSRALSGYHEELASAVHDRSMRLLQAIDAQNGVEGALAELDESLRRGWSLHWERKNLATDSSSLWGAEVPANAVRVWCGRRNNGLQQDQFLKRFGDMLMPLTVEMQHSDGAHAHLRAVLPADRPATVPDEIALVFYKSQEAYENAMRALPGGRWYRDFHAQVFNLDTSDSGFPNLLQGVFELNKPWHLFTNRVDWKTGVVQIYVGVRKDSISVEIYRAAIEVAARSRQEVYESVDGAVLFAAEDYLIYWQHSPLGVAGSLSLEAVADSVFKESARQVVVPVRFSEVFAGIPLRGGEFFNMQFPVLI
jgi:hypothetical protein